MFLNYKELLRSHKYLRPAQQNETERIAEIEASSFPADEKADLGAIRMRRQQASPYFWVLGDAETDIIGYVNGTCTNLDVITHESMETHVSDGSTLVIHSVTIEERFRRKGHATFMLKAYMDRIKDMPNIKLVLLLCKSQLLSFYKSCGFEIVGLSPVVHGAEQWFEMRCDMVEKRRLMQYQIDAFTGAAFKGNPAAVVIGMRSDGWMQSLATENNLAETAFIEPILNMSMSPNVAMYNLRWFTPTREVELCGHATLAAAHCLFSTESVGDDIDMIHFQTKYRGLLSACRYYDTTRQQLSIQLDFPSQPAAACTLTSSECDSLSIGLGIDLADILYSGRSIDDMLIRVSPSVFFKIPSLNSGKLDFMALSQINTRGIIVTCEGSLRSGTAIRDGNTCDVDSSSRGLEVDAPGVDFLSRAFFPRYGVDEDPVTGSAHTTLAPYWCGQFETDRLTGFQFSSRGGLVHVECVGPDRVKLRGESITILKSTILVDE